MLFAAGFGTRMRALTQDRPKPLIQVGGKCLIDHTLGLVRAIYPDTIAVNVHYKADMMAHHLKGSDVHISHETPEILETGGGLRAALPILGSEPVFTSNTDAIWQGPNPFLELAKAWDSTRMEALLLCVPKKSTLGHHGEGDFILAPSGQIVRGPGMVFGGVQIIKTERLSNIKDTAFSLNLLWDQMAHEGQLYGLPYSGRWCDVGTPEGIPLATTLLEPTNV